MERDLVGYGNAPPRVEWPEGARLAVSVVVNYEEGSELSPYYGDATHETRGELPSAKPPEARSLQTESQWEYGGRAGVLRLLRLLERHEVKATFYVCGMALENNPPLGPEIVAHGHDVCGHGYRWVEQWNLDRPGGAGVGAPGRRSNPTHYGTPPARLAHQVRSELEHS